MTNENNENKDVAVNAQTPVAVEKKQGLVARATNFAAKLKMNDLERKANTAQLKLLVAMNPEDEDLAKQLHEQKIVNLKAFGKKVAVVGGALATVGTVVALATRKKRKAAVNNVIDVDSEEVEDNYEDDDYEDEEEEVVEDEDTQVETE